MATVDERLDAAEHRIRILRQILLRTMDAIEELFAGPYESREAAELARARVREAFGALKSHLRDGG